MTRNNSQLQDLGSLDASYKQAFPTARVFIYGQEVTRDLISVNVNQSGGSIERAPSTCTITISNMQDKYIITHQDMIRIGKEKVEKNFEKDIRDFGSSSKGGTGSNIFRMDDKGNLVYISESDLVYPLGNSGTVIKWTKDEANELVPRLALANDEEILYLLGAYGYNNITLADARSIANKLKFQRDLIAGNSYSKSPVLGSWDEGDIPYNIKQQVITTKSEFTTTIVPPTSNSVEFLKYDNRVIYEFPYQEGDCIFHANDPVRVAFRDPYDPRRWFWMFTGFVDIWTENVGVNFDSQISITCTDVTKNLRYSTIQLNNSGRDVNLEDTLKDITQGGDGTLDTSGLILNKEIFKDLRMQEILELVFFGTDSASRIGPVSFEAYERYFDIFTTELLTTDEVLDLMINKWGFTKEEALAAVPNDLNITLTDDIRNKAIDYLRATKPDKFENLKWQGITTARGVPFKRKKDYQGVYFYTYGPPSPLDVDFGAEGVSDFFEWNEIIHHRVRKSDLDTMRSSTARPADFDANISVDQVISYIGGDIVNYPVGHGRVFYFAPAGLTDRSEIGFVDRAFDAGVCAAAHSSFADKLTLLYEVVKLVDWRFYATPKGDVVVEIPFYDHEPQDFFKPKNQNDDMSDTYKKKLQRYEDIFQRQYSGEYSVEEAEELTDLAFDFNTSNVDLVDFNEPFDNSDYDYRKEFVISIEEQSGFSNTFSDRGVTNIYGVLVNYVAQNDGAQEDAIKNFVFVVDPALIPMLGKRPCTGQMKTFLIGKDAAMAFAALEMNRLNAEARSAAIDTLPKFGLMVNRPVLWQYRNYYCNIVSMSHSIAYNSDATTSIDVNQIKAWSGVYDKDGSPVYRHFYDRNKPFSIVDILNKNKSGAKKDTK